MMIYYRQYLTVVKHPQEIEKLISLCLQKFAAGFVHQKGAIFGFSNKSRVIQLRNYFEERSVGLFNYEITLEGGKILTQLQEK